MPIIKLETFIDAPIDRCFDLARSVELHKDSTGNSQEEAIAGTVHGLLGPDDEVTWRARHLGITWTLSVRITVFDRPRHFRDSMTRGVFSRFDHDHSFEESGALIVMKDVFDFDAPLGPIGRAASGLFLTRYMRELLQHRNATIKRVAESDLWREYLER